MVSPWLRIALSVVMRPIVRRGGGDVTGRGRCRAGRIRDNALHSNHLPRLIQALIEHALGHVEREGRASFRARVRTKRTPMYETYMVSPQGMPARGYSDRRGGTARFASRSPAASAVVSTISVTNSC